MQDQGTTSFHDDCRRIHRAWHECARTGDAAGYLALYAEDAVLESPLVPVVLDDVAGGVLHGRGEIHRFLTAAARRLTRRLTHWYRTDTWTTDGERLLIWEYPRVTPDGEQLDIAEFMELEHGLIQRHRIYWGCFGSGLLARQARGEAAL